MKQYKYPSPDTWNTILKRPTFDFAEIRNRVQPILEAVKTDGDAALRTFTERFDKVVLEDFKVSRAEIEAAKILVSDELKTAIQTAAANIKTFHSRQMVEPERIETMQGVTCWRKSVAIEKVGLYIPGGTAPLFSTILMLGIPAKIAGCKDIIFCTPPNAEGQIHPAILYTVDLLGISQIFKIGGAQAIAAMAFGTETTPKVDKIFGPGNQYVTTAKQLVNQTGIAIDMPAGPSELAVVADETAFPAFVAADLLSQAEHGEDSQVVFVTTSEAMQTKVQAEVEKQVKTLPRRAIAEAALANSRSILLKNEAEVINLINAYAPEHLILAVENDEDFADKIINAGSIFLGHYTPESVGDYASGTNHTLPTNGFAKAYSGVSLDSFVKKITYQKLTKQGLQNIGQTVEIMAAAENLEAHKRAVSVRLKDIFHRS
jgi:histidinol dehydrogenase